LVLFEYVISEVRPTTTEVFHDPASAGKAWFYRPVPLAAVALALTIILNIVFH
jgi:SSS family solute:Na+ symporter